MNYYIILTAIIIAQFVIFEIRLYYMDKKNKEEKRDRSKDFISLSKQKFNLLKKVKELEKKIEDDAKAAIYKKEAE